jgi:hypothetical protein
LETVRASTTSSAATDNEAFFAMAEAEYKNILNCIDMVNTNFLGRFILIGGASLIKLQSPRMTKDIDVLVPRSTDMSKLVQRLANSGWFYRQDGVLFVNPQSSTHTSVARPLKVDILTETVNGKTYDDLISHTVIAGGIVMPTLSLSLGIKLRCWFSRAEDENGCQKRMTDLKDIVFLIRKMVADKIHVDEDVAAVIKISHYNLLLVRLELEEPDVERLRDVGGNMFLKKYEDNNEDEREYYEAMGSTANTDPLTVELMEDEEED